MYQYNSNGQKVPMGVVQEKIPVKEHYNDPNSGKKSSSKTLWIWIAVALVVVLVLVGLFIWLRGGKGSSTVSMGMKKGRMGAQRWGFRFY